MTLEERLAALASDMDGALATSSPDGAVTWSRGPDVFAVIGADGGSAEFLLDPSIAVAAVRTPDTTPSRRGAGWVLFRPKALDGHAVDRATAWLLSAYRRAAGR
jgi:hypothetical protein